MPPRPHAGPQVVLLASLLGGLGVAIAWFAYLLEVNLDDRFVGDSVTYFRIMTSWGSLPDAFRYAGPRTLGFPLFLYVVKSAFGVTLNRQGVQVFVDTVSRILLCVHFAASLCFFLSVRRVIAAERGIRLHPVALFLLFAYPGLVAYTTIPLSDSLATDLLMLTASALCLAEDRRPIERVVAGLAAGLTLGFAILVRPSFIVLAAGISALGIVHAPVLCRSRLAEFVIMAGVCAAAVGWQAARCEATFGELCLQDPHFVQQWVTRDVQAGANSARYYWSEHSTDPERIVAVPDPLLTAHVTGGCNVAALLGPRGLLPCLAERPQWVPVFFLKKAIGLFDAYALQSYAADLTPRWARLYTRPYGAVAFAGFAAMVVWLAGLTVAAARGRPDVGLLPLLATIPAVHLLWHGLFTIEPRYGLPAVPFALVAFVLVVQEAARCAAFGRVFVLSGTLLAAGMFLYQTHLWDVSDPVLHQIEGW